MGPIKRSRTRTPSGRKKVPNEVAPAANQDDARSLRGLTGDAFLERICSREFTTSTYQRLRDDTVRTERYQTAIAKTVRGKVVLDIGTGEYALLALMAAKCGAKHVFAIEVNEGAAAKAREVVREKGLAEHVTILTGLSSQLSLPEKAEVVIHELVGCIATEEGVLPIVLDAAKRLLTPSATSIPSRIQSFVVPYGYPTVAVLPDGSTKELAGKVMLAPELHEAIAFTPLDDAYKWEDINFDDILRLRSIPVMNRSKCHFVASSPGTLTSLAVWMEIRLQGGVISSIERGSSWRKPVLVFGNSVGIERGDAIEVDIEVDYSTLPHTYTFRMAANGVHFGPLCINLSES